jgi:putative membrane protein
MLRKTFWLTGVLAAALYVAPAAADDKTDMEKAHSQASSTGTSASDAARDTAADAKRGASSAATSVRDTASDTADRTKDAARDTADRTKDAAGDAKERAHASADRMTDKDAKPATAETKRLLHKLHAANEKEIHHGQAMQEAAKNDQVKDFAKKMVDDHQAMNDDLVKFAKKHDVDLAAAGKPAKDADMAKAHKMVASDAAYMKMMVQEHQKTVKEVHQAHLKAQKAGDEELTALLEKAHEKVQAHLDEARKIQQNLTQRQARKPAER